MTLYLPTEKQNINNIEENIMVGKGNFFVHLDVGYEYERQRKYQTIEYCAILGFFFFFWRYGINILYVIPCRTSVYDLHLKK